MQRSQRLGERSPRQVCRNSRFVPAACLGRDRCQVCARDETSTARLETRPGPLRVSESSLSESLSESVSIRAACPWTRGCGPAPGPWSGMVCLPDSLVLSPES